MTNDDLSNADLSAEKTRREKDAAHARAYRANLDPVRAEELRQLKNAYMRDYRRRPERQLADQLRKQTAEYKVYMKAYGQTPKRKAYVLLHAQKPETRVTRQKYLQSEQGKKVTKLYQQSAEYKAYRKELDQRPVRRATQQTYKQSQEYKNKKKEYRRSAHGRELERCYEATPTRQRWHHEYAQRQDVKDRKREQARQRYDAFPEKGRNRVRARRARKHSAPGAAYTTAQHIRWRIEMFGGRCYVCHRPMQAIDHVIPLAKGGTHWPANLRPICKSCNSSKGDRRLSEWQLRMVRAPEALVAAGQ